MASSSNSSLVNNDRRNEHKLVDFMRYEDLPKPVIVTLGSYEKGSAKIKQGDILLIRSDMPLFISLTTPGIDVVSKIIVSSDCSVKFNVLPPKEYESDSESRCVYPTIKTLLKDCPTYFQATRDWDVPYIPRYSIKAGDKFFFERIIHNPDCSHLTLECVDERANIVRLPGECHGDFIALADDNSYTLREIICKGHLPRRLKVSDENARLTLSSEINISEDESNGAQKQSCVNFNDSNTANIDRASLPGLPLTFKGVLTLNIPEKTLEVSPWYDLDVRWQLPENIDLMVRLYSPSEYEIPVTGDQKNPSINLYEFVSRYQLYPVLASLVDCSNLPRTFTPFLRNISDVIVHKTTRLPCLVVKSQKNEHFIITPNVHVTFADHPRSYSFIFELIDCPIGTQVSVMGDVASDFPAPYSLRSGDIIKITTRKSTTLKMKDSPISEFQVLKCAKLNKNGEFTEILIPIDLELQMFECLDMRVQKLYKLSDMLSKKQELPSGLVSVIEDDKMMDRLPLPAVVTLKSVMYDDVVLISPLKKEEDGSIDPLVKHCLAIPTRHNLFLSFNKHLEFPSDYFVLPRSKYQKNIPVEFITDGALSALQRRNVSSGTYEEIDFPSNQSRIEDYKAETNTVKDRFGRSVNRLSRLFSKPFSKKSRSATENIVLPPGLPGAAARIPRAEGNTYTKDFEGGAKLTLHDDECEDDDTYESIEIISSTNIKRRSKHS